MERIHIPRALSQRPQSLRMPRFFSSLPSQPYALEIVSRLALHHHVLSCVLCVVRVVFVFVVVVFIFATHH